ncbi:hypothetical protein GOBAR_AA32704 [Gossypium barbadense]|uniref:CHD3-type chromatin-remodeling factor PICKLE n=1 Tax=Gossypium barbadense TaxID=3634 RepID=A0A2P5WA70_GOSBA|nr:hypothetical protein GOBAR_AA32704 [Gossypium barbadense]
MERFKKSKILVWKGLRKNMSSLVERLRIRSDRRPVYKLDESDDDADFVSGKSGKIEGNLEKIVRTDAKEKSCQACGEGENLFSCATCTYVYHPKCLLPPLKAPLPDNWRCPECFSPLNDIDKILDCEMRPTVADDNDASKLGSKQIFVKQYLVKWKGLSYLHCTWVPEKEFIKAFKSNPRLRTKVNNFHRQVASNNSSEDDFVAIRPEWTTVDRILACRGDDDDEKEYLVKYKELPYDECYWEFESDISAFEPEIERFNKIQSRSRKSSASRQKSSLQNAVQFKKSKEFQPYEHSPEFLSGGSLHPYQLEGLNFLRFSWSKQTHVILADEMGLGKTIQSIAFLASLFEENIAPHLVVAPLSTLRNWEREFATWAPQMNVVMYVGTSQARAIIREYEFYHPKNHKKIKKKKSGQIVSESKQDRIKFDVLLTSYEMINLDTTSLKPIMWECMIVDEGHRLKNKDSKLFLSLKQYTTNHRTLLTGTPLQNNLDELFMLMHFLDAGKFGSLEEFQEQFKDISQEMQISRLHDMLAPHLLRRLKKDVMKQLPPKKELILRVDLSSKQKEYYKAILTRNYQILTRRGGAQISLINVVMELRKLCCHPYMLEGVEPDIEDANEAYKEKNCCYLWQVANYEVIKESETVAEEETQNVAVENKDTTNNSERTSYWEELLRDRYEVHKVEEFNALGKGKRSRKQMVSVEDDDLAGLEDVSSDGEDFEAEVTDADTSAVNQPGRKPYKKRIRVDNTEPLPLMEGEGKSFRVLGFNQSQRAAFVQILMRFGVGDFDWKEFASRLKQKSYDEIKELSEFILVCFKLFTSIDRYGTLFLTHIAEDITDSPTFSDGVPKEGLRIQDVLVRIAVLLLVSEKVKDASEKPGTRLFTDDIMMRYPTLKGGKFWKEEHDLLLLRAVLKYVSLKFLDNNCSYFNNEILDWLTRKMTFYSQSFSNVFLTVEEELDDIIRYGSKELFADENDEAGKSGQIHYDDAAIDSFEVQFFLPFDRLLDREQADSEDASVDDEADDEILKAFKLKFELYFTLILSPMSTHFTVRHGYGRWQAIVDDKDLRIQEVICQELNLPIINLPIPGQAGSQVQNGANTTNIEPTGTQTHGNGSGNDVGGEVAQGVADTVNQARVYHDPSILYHFRDMQRRQVEYVKKRVLLLEKGLNAEYQKEFYVEMKTNEVASEQQENGKRVADMSNARTTKTPSQVTDCLPPIEVIASEEISAAACNNDADRLELPQHYNKICKILEDNVHEAVQSSLNLKKNLHTLEEICGDISRILSPAEQPVVSTAAGSQSCAARSISPPNQQPAIVTEIEMEDSQRESEPEKPAIVEVTDKDLTSSDPLKDSGKIEDQDSSLDPVEKAADSSQTQTTGNDVMMEETGKEDGTRTQSEAIASENERESAEKSEAGVIVLDD